jgi:hypothetical protein
MQFEEWLLEQINQDKSYILIGEDHFSKASDSCVECILRLKGQGKITKKIIFFLEDLVALDDSKPYSLEQLSQLPVTSTAIKLLVENHIEMYGLENNFSNPFLQPLESIPAITTCLEKMGLQLKDGVRSQEDISSYYLRAQVCYGKSLVRLQRGNLTFCEQMTQKFDEDALVFAVLGGKHIPAVTQDSQTVENGMLKRLGSNRSAGCFINFPSKQDEPADYQPKQDPYGAYERINYCTIPISLESVSSTLLWSHSTGPKRQKSKNESTPSRCCNLV